MPCCISWSPVGPTDLSASRRPRFPGVPPPLPPIRLPPTPTSLPLLVSCLPSPLDAFLRLQYFLSRSFSSTWLLNSCSMCCLHSAPAAAASAAPAAVYGGAPHFLPFVSAAGYPGAARAGRASGEAGLLERHPQRPTTGIIRHADRVKGSLLLASESTSKGCPRPRQPALGEAAKAFCVH